MKINWRDFFKINWHLVPLKFVLFTFGFGTFMVFPFLTLQMVSIGLNLSDVALITALVQVVSFLATPIASFVGDMVGPKIVLFFDIILIAVSGTCIDLTPRYREYLRTPSLTLVPNVGDFQDAYSVGSFTFPPNNCIKGDFTNDVCQDNVFSDGQLEFWHNITKYLDCPDGLMTVGNFTLDTSFFSDTFSEINIKGNGSFCFAENQLLDNELNDTNIMCSIKNHPNLGSCFETEGSERATFWIYLAIRSIFQTAVNSGYALLDGTSLNYMKQFQCDYSMLLLWNMLAAAISPYIASFLIEEPEDPLTDETNYNIAFYAMDGVLAVSFVGVMFIKVVVEKATASAKSSAILELFLNPAIVIFHILNLFLGTGWGVADAYLSIYIKEDLGASYQLLGMGTSIALGSCLPFMPFSTWMAEKIGSLNVVTSAALTTGLRLIAYGFIVWTPPYHYLILSSLDFLCITWQWIACMYYVQRIVPNSVGGTLIGIVGATQNVLGRAIGSFLAGQLVAGPPEMSVPKTFKVLGAATFVGSLTCYLIYKVTCLKYEKKLIDNKLKEVGEEDNKESFEMNFAFKNIAGVSKL